MKNFKIITLIAVVGLLIIGCKDNSKKAVTPEVIVPQQEEVTNVVKALFNKVLTHKNINFKISTKKEGDSNILTIVPSGLSITNETVTHKIDGTITGAEIEDLDSDGFPEVLIYTNSYGSGSYGNLIGYSVNNGKSMSQIYLAPIAENNKVNKGYMGHDEFAIVETSLVQRFPIYKKGDTNANPTGGTRQIQYKLKDGENSRVFVIDKVVEY